MIEREFKREERLIRSFTSLVDTATLTNPPVPLFSAPYPCRLKWLTLLAYTAYTANAANYWTLSLKVYDVVGILLRGIPFSESVPSYDMDVQSLAVGQGRRLPVMGAIDQPIAKDEAVFLSVVENGAGADELLVLAQMDVVPGGV